MGKHSGKGKSTFGKVLGVAGLAAGWANPEMFGLLKTAHFAGAMMGLSLGTTIASAFKKTESTPTSSFDSKMNVVDSTARIPLLYGSRKIGGMQTYHVTNTGDKWLVKDVVLGEGQFSGMYGCTANNFIMKTHNNSSISSYLKYSDNGTYKRFNTSTNNNILFGIVNYNYSDATVRVHDKKITLYYNGSSHDIALQGRNDTKSDLSNDYCCNLSLLYQYIEGINYDTNFSKDGWKIVCPVVTSDSPKNIADIDTTSCYKSAVFLRLGSYDTGDSWIEFYDGSQGAPDYYLKTGGYPNMAYIHSYLKYTDALGSGNPTLTCIANGIQVYDTRTSTKGYSENPAMIVRDYLLNTTYGAGHFITQDMLDEDSFKEVANYCDAIVTVKDSEGRLISEPRYTLNMLISEKKSYLDVLQEMLACFGGFIVFTNGKIALKIEKAESSVYSFDDDNIVQGSLSYKADSTADAPNRLVMNYVEPLLDWTSVKVYVEDLVSQHEKPSGVGKIISKDIQLNGVTSQSQASRLGKIYRDIIRLCPVTVSFKTGAQAMHLEPGDVVKISKKVILEDGTQKDLFKDFPVRITQIQEERGEYTLTCRQYNSSIYDDSLGATLNPHSYVGDIKEEEVLPTEVPQVTNLSCYTIYRQYLNGQTGYDVVVSYDLPDGYSIESGLVYYQTDHIDSTEIGTIPEGVSLDEAGYYAEWKFAGESPNKVIIPQAKIGDTYKIKVIARNKNAKLSSDATAPTETITILAKSTVPNTPQNFSYDFSEGFDFKWDDVTNSDIDFYELRLDDNPGVISDKLLAKCSGTMINVKIIERTGTVYLYAHNSTKKYSYPATLTYNYPKPNAPINIKIDMLLKAFNVTVPAIPENCNGLNLYISSGNYSNMIHIKNNVYSFSGDTGIYTIKAAYVDVFGEGYISQEYTASITPTLDPAYIADESIGLSKINDYLKTAVNNANVSSEAVSTIVANLNKQPGESGYTAITQLSDDVNLRVVKGDVINQINLTPEGTYIDGKYLHVTGTTQFDNDVIVNSAIKAGAITADKLAAGTIVLGNNTVDGFTGGSVTINSAGLTNMSDDGTYVLFSNKGMEYHDANGTLYNMVGKSIMGVGKNGQYVRFTSPWNTVPNVIVIPQNMVVTNPAYSTSVVKLHSYADQVSVNGFYIVCYSGIADASGLNVLNTNIFGEATFDLHSIKQTASQSSTFSFQPDASADKVTLTGNVFIRTTDTNIHGSKFTIPNTIRIYNNGNTLVNESLFTVSNLDWREKYGTWTAQWSKTFNITKGTAISGDISMYATRTDGNSYNVYVRVEAVSMTNQITGETQLDSNGTAMFLVTDSCSTNYSLE